MDVKEFKPTMTKEELIDLLNQSIDVLADDSGWTFLGDLGNLLLKKQPDFDSRCFGYPKLSVMFEISSKSVQWRGRRASRYLSVGNNLT